MTFPAIILVKDLLACHCSYDDKQIAMHQAMYDGGKCMEGFKADLLYKREMENIAGPVGVAQFQERVRKAPYIRRLPGFIDWMVAAVFLDPPEIAIDDTMIKSAEDQDYYFGLNDDADGSGTPLAAMTRETVLASCLHQKSYIGVDFPEDMVRKYDKKTMAARFRLYGANEIEDWQTDKLGNLLWVRWHGSEDVRPANAQWEQPKEEKHTWAFIMEEKTYFYEATKVKTESWKEDAVATRTNEASYSGGLPMFGVKYRKGQWIMSTCFDVARAAFNRDASIEYLGDKFAFQILVVTTDRGSLEDIVLPDLGALKLGVGESAGFIAPQPGVLEPLFKSSEKLSKDLLDSIHASAQNAASIPQAGRLSGDAVKEMREPLHVLLYSFAWPVLEAYNKALARISLLRGDPEGCAIVQGFREFDATVEELEEAANGGERKPGRPSGQEKSGTEKPGTKAEGK